MSKIKQDHWNSNPAQVTSFIELPTPDLSQPGEQSCTYSSPRCGLGWRFDFSREYSFTPSLSPGVQQKIGRVTVTFKTDLCSTMPYRNLTMTVDVRTSDPNIGSLKPRSPGQHNQFSGLSISNDAQLGTYNEPFRHKGKTVIELSVTFHPDDQLFFPTSPSPGINDVLTSSLDGEALIDTKFYLFSGCSMGEPVSPRAVFGNSVILKDSATYFKDLLSGADFQDGIVCGAHEDVPAVCQRLKPETYDYEDDSDLEDLPGKFDKKLFEDAQVWPTPPFVTERAGLDLAGPPLFPVALPATPDPGPPLSPSRHPNPSIPPPSIPPPSIPPPSIPPPSISPPSISPQSISPQSISPQSISPPSIPPSFLPPPPLPGPAIPGQSLSPPPPPGPPPLDRSFSPPPPQGSTVSPPSIESVQLKSGDRVHAYAINGFAHQTWKAFIFYAYTNEIHFNQLKSMHTFPRVEEHKLGCSPKSMYRLADYVNIPPLKALAKEGISQGLSEQNVVEELFSPFTSKYDEIIELEANFLISHFTPQVSANFDNAVGQVVDGLKPYCRRALLFTIKRLHSDAVTEAWNALNTKVTKFKQKKGKKGRGISTWGQSPEGSSPWGPGWADSLSKTDLSR